MVKEFVYEWPELVKIVEKLKRGEKLEESDKLWVKGLAEATGWDGEDIIEELVNVDVNPSERVKKYMELHEEYFDEALKLKVRGDRRQAGEKLWGAVTALVKLYAARKNVYVSHWGRGKLESFITYNVEEKYKQLFRTLLDKVQVFHENFYEANLDDKTFDERWMEAVELVSKVREVVLSGLMN